VDGSEASNERAPIAPAVIHWPRRTGSPEVNDGNQNDAQHSIANILITPREIMPAELKSELGRSQRLESSRS